MQKSITLLLVAALAGTSVLGTTEPSRSQSNKKVEILLVSYAVTKAAYDRIIPKFRAEWKKKTGQDVVINTSFGGSGSQTRAIIDGLDADVTNLALASDTEKLVKAGLVKDGWEKELPNNSIVTNSTVAIVTRPKNPKKISGWQDLAKPNVDVVTANPKTSGVARWNFLALWGSVTENGGTESQARQFVGKVFKNVDLLAKDAREATDIFIKKGQGDALLNYENELILARLNGEREFPYVIPSTNIRIEPPVAVVDKNVDKKGTRKVAQAFAQYLFTPTAQEEFAKLGFRPVNKQVLQKYQSRFAKINKFYTVKEFGGWDVAQKKFFGDGGLFDQIFAKR
jgi:sulfate transport system substrate-binding protein